MPESTIIANQTTDMIFAMSRKGKIFMYKIFNVLHQDDMKKRMNSSYSSNHPGGK